MNMDTRCIKCEGSGIYYRPNGEDDFDHEYCDCPEGKRAEKGGVINVFPESGTTPIMREWKEIEKLWS